MENKFNNCVEIKKKKQFVIMPRSLKKLTGAGRFNAVYVYFVIRSFECDNKSAISIDKLTEYTKLSNRKIIDIITELKKEKLIDVEKHQSKNNSYKYSVYSFSDNESSFEMIDKELLTLELESKLKGFLIMLKLECDAGCNYLHFDRLEDLAKSLKSTRQTVSKNLKLVSDFYKDYFKGLIITNELFTFKETNIKEKQFITL